MALIIRLKIETGKVEITSQNHGFCVDVIHWVMKLLLPMSICMMAQMKGLNIINIHYFQFNIIQKRRQALVTLTICLMSLFK